MTIASRKYKKQYCAEYHLLHKEEINARSRRNYKKNRERDRANSIKRYFLKTHGITLKELEEMLNNQDGKCAICNDIIYIGGKFGAHVDHDHESKLFRGILCSNCNLGLGQFKDNTIFLLRAINYLKDFRIRKFILVRKTTEKSASTAKRVFTNPFAKTGS